MGWIGYPNLHRRPRSGAWSWPITGPDPARLRGSRHALSSAPEVLKPIRRQLGIAHRVLNVLVAEPGLQRPSVVTGIGQRIAAAMAQHVRMNRERQLGPDPIRPNSAWKALGVIGPSRSVMKTCDDGPCSRCSVAGRVSRHPASDGRSASRSWPCGRVAGRWSARPATIADRTAQTPAGHAGSRSGSWSRRDGPSGCPSGRLPSAARSRAPSDTRECELRNLQLLVPPPARSVFHDIFPAPE